MALTTYNLEEEEEKLGHFVLYASDAEMTFILAAQRRGYRLDAIHSLDSLEELERYATETGVNFVDTSDAAVLEQVNAWYYLGEVVRQNFGGEWEFSMNDENTANWGAYVVVGHCPVPGIEFEPLGLFRAFVRRGYPAGMFRRAVMADVKPQRIDLSDLPTEKGNE